MGKGKLRGEQIKDESIESVDIASGSIKAGELSTEAITGQVLLNPADATNDRLLVWDADADVLKQVSPQNLGITATVAPAGSNGQIQFNDESSTGAAAQLYWHEGNNRLGIGTNNPTRQLDIEGADNASIQLNATNYRAYSVQSDAYGFTIFDDTRGTTAGYRFVISDSPAALGYVGIGAGGSIGGTLHPDALLHLSSSDDGAILQVDTTDGTTVLFATGSGRVGIGTASPSNTLHVYADASGDYVAVIDNDAGSSGHGLKVTSDGSGTGTNVFDIETGSTTFFRARGDGKVGIGKVTSLPAAVLTVSSSNDDGDIAIAHKIQHIGDSGTFVKFDDKELHLSAGSKTMLKLEGDGVSQVLILSGGAAASYNEASGADVNFYVSGSVGSQGTSTRGTAVFGGDVSISGSIDCAGNLYVADSAGIYTDKIRRYSDSDNTTKILLNDELIKLYAGHSSDDIVRIGDTNIGDDNNFWVSGSVGSRGTSTPGTAVFGGDLAVSGSISGSTFYGDGSNLTGISGGSGSPGGSNTEIQFNNSSAFGGDAKLTWDSSVAELAVYNISSSNHISASTIHVHGDIHFSPSAIKTSSFTISHPMVPMYRVNTSSGAVTASLPALDTDMKGQWVNIKDIGLSGSTNNVVIMPNGSDTIDGAAGLKIKTNGGSVGLQADPDTTEWYIIFTN
jgi:hypothetical protein